MLTWLLSNKEWLFSGAGVAVLGGIWAIVRFMRRPTPSVQQIVVRVDGVQSMSGERNLQSVHIEKISSVTAKDIHNALDTAVPMQKASVQQRYVGLKIEWDTQLSDAQESDGLVRLFLIADAQYLFSVWCTVAYDEYRELGILPKGSKIRVYGEIEEAELFSVHLKNVELRYLEAKST